MEWLNEHSRRFLKNGYLLEGTEPEDRIQFIADRAQEILGIEGFSDKFKSYMEQGFYSLSSPIWSNFGLKRGLPISCYGSYVDDSMNGILSTAREVGIMSKQGGGTSAYVGDIRHRGAPITDNGKSEGVVNFLRLYDTLIDVTKQGETRRGAFAAYIDIDHEDYDEFLEIRQEGSPVQGIFTGVNVTDSFMERMMGGDVKAAQRWVKTLKARFDGGLPYILYIDTANRHAPDVYRDKNIKINNSNLCSEVMLSNQIDESFVCDLSSVNIAKWDKIVKSDAVETLVFFLDAVMSEFIEKARHIAGMENAVRFAINQRAVGVGALGWHDYLQQRMTPFDSDEASVHNKEIFSQIEDRCLRASRKLAVMLGEPPLLVGYGRRNVTVTAVAPTTSSAFILGQTSQSIEPYKSNYYVKDVAKAKVTYRNPHLTKLLRDKGLDNPDIWRSILEHDGSVQHLTESLTDHERNVFKTFGEINQMKIIEQAADRQKFIDQSQSLNLMIHPKTPLKEVNNLYITAWKLGVKSLYYQHSINAAQAFNQELMSCKSCEA